MAKYIVVPVCKKHPRYGGVYPPRVSCVPCSAIYILRHQ